MTTHSNRNDLAMIAGGALVALLLAVLVTFWFQRPHGREVAVEPPATASARSVKSGAGEISVPSQQGSGPESVASVSPFARLSGRVLDRVSGTAIASASVTLKLKHAGVWEGRKSVSADERGAWSAEVPPGDYLVDASAPGFVSLYAEEWSAAFRAAFLADAGKVQLDEEYPRLRVLLKEGSALERDLQLAPGVVLRGFVLGPSGARLQGAEVRAMIQTWEAGTGSYALNYLDDEPATRSDALGAFEMTSLLAGGRLTLRVSLPGYVTLRQSVLLTGANSEVTLKLSEVPAELAQNPADLVRIPCRVVDSAGHPIAGARIFCVYDGRRQAAGESRKDVTDTEGVLEIRERADGMSCVGAWAPGYGAAAVAISRAGEAVTITLPEASGTVRGYVHDESGLPLSGVHVCLHQLAVAGEGVRGWALLPVSGASVPRSGPGEFTWSVWDGHSPMPISATTGEDGTFELKGVAFTPDRPARLIVRKDGLPDVDVEVCSSALLEVTIRK